MTDDDVTPSEASEPDAEAPAEGGAVVVATETPAAPEVPETPAAPAPPGPPARPPHLDFWHRPYVDRYLTPFVLPLLVVTGVIVYILNISRLFLSAHGNADVIAGTIVTLTILIGAISLASAGRMRTQSVVLIVGGLLGAMTIAGMLSLGHSEVQGEATGSGLPPEGAALAEFKTIAGPANSLRYEPAQGTVPTGIVRITLDDDTGEHTLDFEDPKTLFHNLHVTGPGATDSARAFFPAPGDYGFFCAIPGHREAGMVGTLHATGDTQTIDAALAAAEAGGGGATTTTAGG